MSGHGPRRCVGIAGALLAAQLVAAQPAATGEDIVESPPYVIAESQPEPVSAGSTVQLQQAPGAALSLDALAGDLASFAVASAGAHGFGDVQSLRGMANTPFFGPSAVTVYLDDAPLPRGTFFPEELFGLASAELHRGPEANTVFGCAGPAGVLAFVSPEPDGEKRGEVRVAFGDFGARRVLATASAKPSTAFDVFTSATFASREGFVRNTQLDQTVDDRETVAARTRLRWRPNDEVELALQLGGSRSRDGTQPFVPLGGPLFTVARDREGETAVDAFAAAATARVRRDNGEFRATTSYTRWDLSPYSNRLVLPPPLDSAVNQRQENWSEELRYSSQLSPAARWHAGAYWSELDSMGDVQREIPELFPIEASSFDMTSRSLAGFGEMELAFSDRWTVSPGLRVERSTNRIDRRETVPAVGRFGNRSSSDAFLPKVALKYAIAATTALRASVGSGFKPGGFSAFTGDAALARFGPERSHTLEAALTHVLRPQALTATARVFWYAIDGYQIERSFTATDYLVVNAPRARSRGVELELAWRPTERWTVDANFGATDVTLRRFTDPFSGASFAGRRAPYVPRWDAHLGLEYREPRGWFAGIDLGAVGTTFYDESENAAFAQPSYLLVRAQVGFATNTFRVLLFGANLTDERYYASINPGIGHGIPGAPRTVGVEAALTF